MSRLSQALQAALDRTHLSQTQLAEQTSVGLVQINRYARGRARITWDNFEKLLDVFPPEEQGNLLRAYLLDEVAPRFHNLIEITPHVGVVQEPPALPAEFNDLPRDLLEAFRFVAARSHERPVRDLIFDLARLLRAEPRQPSVPSKHMLEQAEAEEQRRIAAELRKAEARVPHGSKQPAARSAGEPTRG